MEQLFLDGPIFTVSPVHFVFKQDFMKPVVSSVDYLLSAGYDVNIYNGQLDLIVSTPSVLAWVNQLTWPGERPRVNGDVHMDHYIDMT